MQPYGPLPPQPKSGTHSCSWVDCGTWESSHCETALQDFSPVSAEYVQQLLVDLDVGKSQGQDDIHPWLLKAAADRLSCSLAELFNCSLRTGTVPGDFKLANITPILKPKQDSFLAASYRGISLLSVLSKLLEKVVRQQILDFLALMNFSVFSNMDSVPVDPVKISS